MTHTDETDIMRKESLEKVQMESLKELPIHRSTSDEISGRTFYVIFIWTFDGIPKKPDGILWTPTRVFRKIYDNFFRSTWWNTLTNLWLNPNNSWSLEKLLTESLEELWIEFLVEFLYEVLMDSLKQTRATPDVISRGILDEILERIS